MKATVLPRANVKFESLMRKGTHSNYYTVTALSALLMISLGFLAYSTSNRADCSTKGQSPITAAAALWQSAGTDKDLTNGLLSGLLRPQEATPDFLDAAVKAGVDKASLRNLVQLQQQAFCLAGHHREPLPGVTGVPFGNVTLHVYGQDDIVSNDLRAGRPWEKAEVTEWLWALQQWQRPAAPANSNASVPDRPLAVDIGANLGWFSLQAATAGARVAAFEAMPANIALIRRTLCSNSWMAERVALYGTGLGDEVSKCFIISDSTNRGDGIVECNMTDRDAYLAKGYQVRGVIPIRLLDTLLDAEVQALKIDVEGFEQRALNGAKQLLSSGKVRYLMAECNTGIIGVEGGKQFIQFLHQVGFEVSPQSFQGPFFTAEQVTSGTAACSAINLFARRRAV